MSCISSSSTSSTSRSKNGKDIMDIQSMLDSIHLDGGTGAGGRIGGSQVDELAAAIQQKLGITIGDEETFRDIAQQFIRMNIMNKKEQQQEQQQDDHDDDPTITTTNNNTGNDDGRPFRRSSDDPSYYSRRPSSSSSPAGPSGGGGTIPSRGRSPTRSSHNHIPRPNYSRGHTPPPSSVPLPSVGNNNNNRSPLPMYESSFVHHPWKSPSDGSQQHHPSTPLKTTATAATSTTTKESPLHRRHRSQSPSPQQGSCRRRRRGGGHLTPPPPPVEFYSRSSGTPQPPTTAAAAAESSSPAPTIFYDTQDTYFPTPRRFSTTTPTSTASSSVSSPVLMAPRPAASGASAIGGSFTPGNNRRHPLSSITVDELGQVLGGSSGSISHKNGHSSSTRMDDNDDDEDAVGTTTSLPTSPSPYSPMSSPNTSWNYTTNLRDDDDHDDDDSPPVVDHQKKEKEEEEEDSRVTASPKCPLGSLDEAIHKASMVVEEILSPAPPSSSSTSGSGSGTSSSMSEGLFTPQFQSNKKQDNNDRQDHQDETKVPTAGSSFPTAAADAAAPAPVVPPPLETAVKKKACHAATPLVGEPTTTTASSSSSPSLPASSADSSNTIQFKVDLSRAKSLRTKATIRSKRGGNIRKGGLSCVTGSNNTDTAAPAPAPAGSTTTPKPSSSSSDSPVNIFSPMDVDPPLSTTTPTGPTTVGGGPTTSSNEPNGTTTTSTTIPVLFHPGVTTTTTTTTATTAGRFRANIARNNIARRRNNARNQTRQGGGSDSLPSSPTSHLNNAHQQQQPAVPPPSPKPTVVDNSFAQRAMVVSLRESARSSYVNGDYQTSIVKYTTAITTYKIHFAQEVTHDLLSVLLSNRAAGLLMVGAFEAAVQDCQQALQIVSDPARLIVSSDPGPALPSKLYTRLGRALIKLGEASLSEAAFDQAIQSAKNSLGLCMTIPETADVHLARKGLQQIVTEATLGKTDAARFRDTMDHVTATFNVACQSPSTSARPKFVEALGHVNLALSTASGCSALQQKKVVILARLKRWREIANHCERLACDNVRFDNVFTDDLVSKHPFLGVRPAKSLVADFFRRYEEGDAESIDLKLGSKAAAEAVLRIPDVVSPYYIRSLRLEERYVAAELGLTAIEGYISSSHSGGGVGDHGRLQARFSWVPGERGKVTRTKTGKDRGDELYRAADYDMAAAQYAMCLTIDSEGIASDDIDGSSAGGRLHAVLHCNRAACFMALRRFHEAVTECTAALRIHARYMKALLRRAQCFNRLDRHDEAIAEYRRWMDMVQEAKRTPLASAAAANVFDGPHDATDDDILRVNREFEAASKAKADHEAAAHAEAAYRQQRQSWNGTQQQQQQQHQYQGDAQRRRDFFYSQKGTGSRRWDSFRERGPKSSSSSRNMGGGAGGGASGNNNNRSGEDSRPRGGGGGTGNSTSELCLDTHYTTLDISRHATAAEIKKAYRKLALKYHPDKNSAPEASELFRLVTEAYEVLNDTKTRRKYDSGLSRFR